MEGISDAHATAPGGFDARTLRRALAAGAIVPVGVAGVLAVALVVLAFLVGAEFGGAGAFVVPFAFCLAALLCAVLAARCIARVRRASYSLACQADRVIRAAERETTELRHVTDEFRLALGERGAFGRLLPKRPTAYLIGRVERETAGESPRLSAETLGQVRLIRDAADRWQDSVA
ncbi:hypothetical protein AB0B15_38470 [Streptomyces sp. NPDC045456]|uniref:hypothetical protein n=1 Tax=Streptomyces sp. NPDC045456 TaxID=3155254 RepID=UPI0033F883C5